MDASEVTDLHIISYEVEQDLMPLILSNCQYQVEQGKETLQEFDLEKIQRQVTGRFLQGKPRITLMVRRTPGWSLCWRVCSGEVGPGVAFFPLVVSERGRVGMPVQPRAPPEAVPPALPSCSRASVPLVFRSQQTGCWISPLTAPGGCT